MASLPNPTLKYNWGDLQYYTTKLFSDDFCQLDGLTYGVQGSSTQGTNFALSQSLYFRDNWQIFDRLKFRVPIIRDKTVDGYINNEKFNLNFNHGVTVISNRPFYFYGGFGAFKNGDHPHIKLGVLHKGKNCYSDNRVKVQSNLTFTWYHKTILNINQFIFGALGVFNLTEVKVVKKDLFIGYLKNRFEVYLRGEQAWDKPTENWNNISQYFTNIYLTGVFNRNPNQIYGLEIVHNSEANKLKQLSVLADYYYDKNNRIKTKINSFGVVTLMLQRHFNAQVGASVGISFPLRKSQGHRRTRTGMRLFFNV